MAVKSKSKAKTTEFEKLVASYAERVNNGELTPLKAVQYREFGDVRSLVALLSWMLATGKAHALRGMPFLSDEAALVSI